MFGSTNRKLTKIDNESFVIGKYRTAVLKISNQNPLCHFDEVVFYNGRRYEIGGDKKKPNEVLITEESYESFIEKYEVVKKTRKFVDKERIESFINDWDKEHSKYTAHADSCQNFARDIADELFDIKIDTKLRKIVNFVFYVFVIVGLIFLALVLTYLYLAMLLRQEEENKRMKHEEDMM